MSLVPRRSWSLLLILLSAAVPFGCISKTRVVPAAERLLPAQSASREALLQSLDDRSKSIDTLSSTVVLDFSEGALKTGVLTEYRQTKAFIVVERPNHIQIKAQAPLVLGTVFDMVSDGQEYRVSIPPQNKFFVGDTLTPPTADKPILNLRPQHILDALFVDIRPYLNQPGIFPVLEETVVGRTSYYVVSFIDTRSANAQLIQKIWIDRSNMEVSRKEIFGLDGKVETDVVYSQYQMIGGIPYPQIIQIQRPIEDYGLKMTFQRIDMNVTLAADAFQLERPAGSELIQIENGGSSKRN